MRQATSSVATPTSSSLRRLEGVHSSMSSKLDSHDLSQQEAPPPFDETTDRGHLLVDFERAEFAIPAGGEDPPPPFTIYEAEHFVSADGDSVISHDHHLNRDGMITLSSVLMLVTHPYKRLPKHRRSAASLSAVSIEGPPRLSLAL